MTHLVCGGCHMRAAAPVGLAARRSAPASHGRPVPPRASASSGVQGYSPPPPPVSPIKGLIDFHTHAAPDIFGRALDDDELATLAATRQMEAVVFQMLVAGLMKEGITRDQIATKGRETPGSLLMG
jgi:mono/diheme cytochrome c family protein